MNNGEIMLYILYIIVIPISYLILKIIRKTINKLFPNFYIKNKEKFISHGKFSSGVKIKEKNYENDKNIHEDLKDLLRREKERKEKV